MHATIADLLGPGDGPCLDVCCGTGAHAAVLSGLGFTPVGVDLSGGRLRHAAGRLPVAVADATVLPVADAGVRPRCACWPTPTYRSTRPSCARSPGYCGGRFVHVGVHPCFIGPFADWSGAPRIAVDQRYTDRAFTYDAWNPARVRARVGGWHVPLADLLNATLAAGLRPVRTAEAGPPGVPDLFGYLAVKP